MKISVLEFDKMKTQKKCFEKLDSKEIDIYIQGFPSHVTQRERKKREREHVSHTEEHLRKITRSEHEPSYFLSLLFS